MNLSIEVRNEISLKKCLLILRKTILEVSSTKLWTTHVFELDPYSFDYDEMKKSITTCLITDFPLSDVIHKIHSEMNGTVLEDKEETLVFFNEIHRQTGNINGNKKV